MKRHERHHLKENELARLTTNARVVLEQRRGQMLAAVVAVAVIAAVLIGYAAWRGRVQSRAGALLAEALIVDDARVGPPPAPDAPATGPSFPTEREKREALLEKLTLVADQYPSTEAGIFARYRRAATLMSLGRPAEAVTAYQEVVDRAGDRIYGQMARLGRAEAQAQLGQHDAAIETFRELSQQTDGPLPIDGVLLQLGRVYREAGKPTEAQQTFNRLVDEFPTSPFTSEARRELESLNKT